MTCRPDLFNYLLLLNCCTSVIWWWVAAANAQLTDSEADKNNLNSIYEGTINAQWESKDLPDCGTQKFGPIGNARLTFGKNHYWNDPNPFYISIYGGEQNQFSGSMMSSVSSSKQNYTWWALQAARRGDGFIITGTMLDPSHNTAPQQNAFISAIDAKDKDKCGGELVLNWKYGKNTFINGFIDPDSASITLIGGVEQNGDGGREFHYAFGFDGNWVNTSAILKAGPLGPSWKPGTGPPLPEIRRVSIAPTTSSTTKHIAPSKTVETPCLVTTVIWLTLPPQSSSQESLQGSPPKRFKSGVITSIVVASASLLSAVIVGLVFFRAWWSKRKLPSAYPELALIYSAPPAGWTPGRGGGAGAGVAAGAGRKVATMTAGDQRGAYNQIPQRDSSLPLTSYSMRGGLIPNDVAGGSGSGSLGSLAEQREPMLRGGHDNDNFIEMQPWRQQQQ